MTTASTLKLLIVLVCAASMLLAGGCQWNGTQSVVLEDITPSRAQRRDEAVQQFAAQHADASFAAAMDQWHQGNLPGCQEHLERLLERFPTYQPAILLLAEIQFVADRPDDAARILENALEAAGSDESYRHAAAVLALRYNRPELAVRLLTPLPDGLAPSAGYFRALAVGHYRCGDYAAAEAALEQALALDNQSALAYFLLGCTRARLGRKSLADAAFREAARLDPSFRAAPQAASLQRPVSR